MRNDLEFIILLFCIIFIIPLVIWFTKLIVNSDLPMWLKFIILK